MRRCESCGAVIAGRTDRRYCSGACRVAAHRRAHRPPAPRTDLAELVAALDATTSEVALTAGVMMAARQDSRAAAWLLERRHPERWAPPASRPAQE
jgi:hypothetical protein